MEKHVWLRTMLLKNNICSEKMHDTVWPYLLDYGSYDINIIDQIIFKNKAFGDLSTIWPYNNNFYQEVLENYHKISKSNKK